MTILCRLRLRTKLALLAVLSSLALIAAIALGASVLHHRMMDDRIDKLRALVLTARGFAEQLEQQVQAGRLTRAQAIATLREQLHHVRFGGKDDYFLAQTYDGMVVMHGGDPAREGKPTTARDAQGRSSAELAGQVLRGTDGGVISYDVAKPGHKDKQPKLSYVGRFPPWQLDFIAGSWIDDINAVYGMTLRHLMLMGGAVLVLSLLLAWLIDRDIVGSLGGLRQVMVRLSHNELDFTIPGTNRRDEVGEMANTVLVFRNTMAEAENLRAAQEAERNRSRLARRKELLRMAETIETETKDAVAAARERTAAMADAATKMTGAAGRTGAAARDAAAAAAQALRNADTVAQAAEHLAAAIREIGSQVGHSNQVVARAVEAGHGTREQMDALNEQVARIGGVADMINEIAARTNLLALNATIEAARAGEAGKGFAVVASEVKSLATQTARATDQISRHIAEVRGATSTSVEAVRHIETTIGEVDAIASSIAAAVEQQSAATSEIARSIAETAAAANQMTERTREVSSEADTTRQDAAQVLANTGVLNETLEHLHRALVRAVRSSTGAVDRQQDRRPCYVMAELLHSGQTDAVALHNIGVQGCLAVGESRRAVGEAVEIILREFGLRLRGKVASRSEAGLDISFDAHALSAADADRISLSTIDALLRHTKEDHRALVQTVADAVMTGEAPKTGLETHRNCRLGRWYDSLADSDTLALPAIQAISEPHRAMHACSQKALAAVAAGQKTEAQRWVAELRQHSDRVDHCLDEFALAYRASLVPAQADREMAHAA